MRQKCRNCDKNCENGDLCFKCKPRKPFPKVGGLKKTLTREVIEEAMNDIFFRKDFFFNIWKKRPHKSEISGEFLSSDFDGFPSTAYFHHILPKNKYKFAEFDEENIVLLSIIEHDNVEMDMYKYEEINKKRELLKLKYNL